MTTNNKIEKAAFLSDKPMSADQFPSIKFGHESIAHSLSEIILESPTPFSIGLFGRWGSGKTTIINLLKKRLEGKGILMPIVDAWKYEGDSLRRQFLISLDEELKLGLDYANKLNQSLTETDPTKGELKFDWGIFLNQWGLLFGLFFIIPIFLKYFNNANLVLDTTQAFGLLGYLFQAILGLFKRVSITITEHRTDSAEGFERLFTKGILSHAKVKGKKLLIVVDNLDRCSDRKAVELLSTIKTFLAKDSESENSCIFLIPCDDEAIKIHLKNIYSQSADNVPFNTDEFLRKFFNVSLSIPPIIDTELQDYTEDLLKMTGIKELDAPKVAYVITYAFRQNPRQIKQFINTLLAHYLLAQKREQGSAPTITSKGIITGNVAFLAKILIIKQQYSTIYDLIVKNHLTLEEITQDKENKLYHGFLAATRTVAAKDLRPFIYLKQSKEEVSIPKLDELVLALTDNKTETVNALFEEMKSDKNQLNSLIFYLPSLLERNKNREAPLLNIISALLIGLKTQGIVLRGEAYNRMAKALNKGGVLNPRLIEFQPELMINSFLGYCDTKDRTEILDSYIHILETKTDLIINRSAFEYNLIKELLPHRDWLNAKQKGQLKHLFMETYSAHFDILSLFANDIPSQKEFIEEGTILGFSSSLSDYDVENPDLFKSRIGLLMAFNEIFTEKFALALIKKLASLINTENNRPITGREQKKEALLSQTALCLAKLHKQMILIKDQDVFNNFSSIIVQGALASPHKHTFIPLMIELKNSFPESNKPQLVQQIQRFLASADIKSLNYIFSSLGNKTSKEIIIEFKDILRQPIKNDPNILELVYPMANEATHAFWIKDLVNSPQYQIALNKITSLNYEIDFQDELLKDMLNRAANAVSGSEKEAFYKVINGMKCGGSQELKNEFASQAKTLLTQMNEPLQRIGYLALEGSKYLGVIHRRDVTRGVIEFLKQLPQINSFQPYSINSVLLNWPTLGQQITAQKEFIDFIFYKLIIGSRNSSPIKLGFDALNVIEPKYEDYDTYYEDTYNEAGKHLEPIKGEILNGLMRLKPIKLSKMNKSYWEKVTQACEQTKTA